MSINLRADQVPIPTGPTAAIDPSDATDTTTPAATIEPLATGMLGSEIPEALNKALAHVGLAAGFAGTAYGVADGLALSNGGGLSLEVAEGTAMIYGAVRFEGGAMALPNNTSRIHIWLKQDGTLTYALTNAAPQNEAVYLGSAVTSGGAITQIDESGVCRIVGGHLVRRTADLGAPADAPSSRFAFYTRTQDSMWLWDGAAYRHFTPTGFVSITIANAGETTATIAQASNRVLDLSGSLSATRSLVLPAIIGREWIIRNNCGESVIVKTAGKAGIAVSAGHVATLGCDANGIFRISADRAGTTPVSATDLARWYDFSDLGTLFQDSSFAIPVTADSQPIGGIRDKSGNGRDLVQATSSRRPSFKSTEFNGRPCALFDAVDDFLRSIGATDLAQPLTVVLVGQHVAATASQVWYDATTTFSQFQQSVTSGTLRSLNAGTALSGGAPDTNRHVFIATFDGATSELMIDGSVALSGNAGTNSLAGFTLGSSRSSGGASFLNGRVAEVLVYPRKLSAAEKTAITAYAQAKHGI